MKLIIAGSRYFNCYELLCGAMRDYGLDTRAEEIVSGGARGADNLGEVWAEENGVPVALFEADWDTYGKAAGPMRNAKMADYGTLALVFWDGHSKGTANLIQNMAQRGKSFICVGFVAGTYV